MVWQIQEAKNRFSEVVDKALSEGPQEVSRRGHKAVVVISVRDYENLVRKKKKSLLEFLRDSPFSDISIERNLDLPRSVEL